MDENRKDENFEGNEQNLSGHEKESMKEGFQLNFEDNPDYQAIGDYAAKLDRTDELFDDAQKETPSEQSDSAQSVTDDSAMNESPEAERPAAQVQSSVRTKKKRKKKKSVATLIIFGSVIVAASILLATLIMVCFNDMYGLYKEEKEVLVDIPKSANTQQISEVLKEKDVIKYPILFRMMAQSAEKEKPFQYGLHTFNTNFSYDQIFEELQRVVPKKDVVKLVIKEGESLDTIAENVEKLKICSADDFINVIDRQEFGFDFEDEITVNKLKYHRIEGFVFPDTYECYVGEAPEDVAKRILSNFQSKITNAMMEKMKARNMSLEKTLTLASIVQAEAGEVSQMKKVAGVFYNRLAKPSEYPKLESDPTRKYVEEDIKPNIKVENQEIYDAYNTYVGNGLPPGPICNPGLDAINAVLEPESSDYYYFCSNLKTREFFYAKTLQQHNINLRKAGLR